MRHFAGIILLTAILFGQIKVFSAENLTIPGTGACEELLKLVAEKFNQEQLDYQIIIPPSVGSGGGIKAVDEGSSLLGRVARPLTDEEKRAGLRAIPFAKDSVVFVVGLGVNINNLSTKQLLDIFSGDVKNWQEVGDDSGFIRLLIREPTDSSLNIIKQYVKGFDNIVFSSKAKLLYHDYEMVQLLSKYKRSIGWLSGSSVNTNQFSVINIDQIEPSMENITTGRYPLSVEYSLVYKDRLQGNGANLFIDFLFSEKGQAILESQSLVPLIRN